MRFLSSILGLLFLATSLQAQAVIVVDSVQWIHAVAAPSYDSTKLTLAPGQTLTVRYVVKDVSVFPALDLSAGPVLWTVTNADVFSIQGVGSTATLNLIAGATLPDSTLVFATLSSPRLTAKVPEIGLMLFIDNPHVYECRGTSFPNLALWGFGDLRIHFQDGSRDLDCYSTTPTQPPIPPTPVYDYVIQVEFTGAPAPNFWAVRVRVVDTNGQPVTDQFPAVQLLSGQWGNDTNTTRVCQSMIPDGCTPGTVYAGTVVNVTLDGALAVQKTAGS